MQKKTDSADTECLEAWGIPLLARDWKARLKEARTNPEKLAALLVGLSADEGLVVELLFHNGYSQPRSWLLSKTKFSHEQLDLCLQRLTRIKLITLSRNRSRLDDSADRIELESESARSLAQHSLISMRNAKTSLLYPLWTESGPLAHAVEYAQICGGVLPKEMPLDPPLAGLESEFFTTSYLLTGQGFVPVQLLIPGKALPESSEGRTISERLDGMAILARILRHTMRSKMRACEGLMPGKRELLAWAEAGGYQPETVRLIFAWLAANGWLADKDGLLTPTNPAREWLSADTRKRHEVLRAMFTRLPQDGKWHLWSTLYQASLRTRPLLDIQDWNETCTSARTLTDEVSFFWHCGVLALQLTDGRLHKLALPDYETLAARKDGSLVVTGDMTILIAEEQASPLQLLLLTAFCRIEKDSGMIRARLTEKFFIEGLAAGYEGKAFLEMLENSACQPLPQNIVFTLTDWMETTSEARLQIRPVLHLAGERLDELMHDPAFAKLVDRRPGADDIILNETNERELGAILERHGIILDYDPPGRDDASGLRT